MTRFSLPWPPSINHYWRHARGQHFISAEGTRYRELVAFTARSHQVPQHAGRLAVLLACYPPDRRRRDIDNLPKALLDALTHARVWEDDSQIDALLSARMAIVPGGRVDVHIIEPAQMESAYLALRRAMAVRAAVIPATASG